MDWSKKYFKKIQPPKALPAYDVRSALVLPYRIWMYSRRYWYTFVRIGASTLIGLIKIRTVQQPMNKRACLWRFSVPFLPPETNSFGAFRACSRRHVLCIPNPWGYFHVRIHEDEARSECMHGSLMSCWLRKTRSIDASIEEEQVLPISIVLILECDSLRWSIWTKLKVLLGNYRLVSLDQRAELRTNNVIHSAQGNNCQNIHSRRNEKAWNISTKWRNEFCPCLSSVLWNGLVPCSR